MQPLDSFNAHGKFSLANQAHVERQRKRRIIIISVSSVILVTMVVAVAVGVGVSVSLHNATGIPQPSDGTTETSRAITAICQGTAYKQTCIDSLSSSASGYDTTDPKELVKLSFKVTIDHIRKAFSQSDLLKEAAKDVRAEHALESCKELMDYAVDDLKRSLNHIDTIHSGHDVDDLVNSIKIWLSGAMTYQETCLDGFENTTGDIGDRMKKLLKTANELTSNTLSIVSQISSVLNSFDFSLFRRRRLMTAKPVVGNDGFPTWVTAGKRKLLAVPTSKIVPNVVVAKDGSGDYTTINDALMVVPILQNETFVIYVKAGVYDEIVRIASNQTHVMLLGDGPTKTKITGNRNFIDGIPTFKSATFAAIGNGFIARDIGFENSAGAEKHQAVALRVQSDLSIFYNCQIDGYQDTLYAHTHRQFYRDCTVSGTIDFIFGNSAVVLQNCVIVARKPLSNQQNTITAQGRKEKDEPTALILHNCTIVADPAYYPLRNTLPTYLGRPWKLYSRTFIMQSWMDDLIHPAGWEPWLDDFALDTLFYSEFDNRGPGASTANRVQWKGLKNITTDHALKFTVEGFIMGSQWIKQSGVPYIGGLLPLGYAATPTAAFTAAAGPTAAPPPADDSTEAPAAANTTSESAPSPAPTPAAADNSTSELAPTPAPIGPAATHTTSELTGPEPAAVYNTTSELASAPAPITAATDATSESPVTSPAAAPAPAPSATEDSTTSESAAAPATAYKPTNMTAAIFDAENATTVYSAALGALHNTTNIAQAPISSAPYTATGEPPAAAPSAA
ncbi:probable pectinesterase/pectinesterase inhibitor 58 [Nymphaea colorata]|nr:probable pectinesterase/pectinesterase inhibitor 58 [Nymphaea colorata]